MFALIHNQYPELQQPTIRRRPRPPTKYGIDTGNYQYANADYWPGCGGGTDCASAAKLRCWSGSRPPVAPKPQKSTAASEPSHDPPGQPTAERARDSHGDVYTRATPLLPVSVC